MTSTWDGRPDVGQRAEVSAADLVVRVTSGQFDGAHGVRVDGISVVDGPVDLSDIDLARPVRFSGCDFAQGLRLGRTRLGGLLIRDCTIGCIPETMMAVESPELRVAGSVRVLASIIRGSLDLRGAHVDGSVIVSDTTVEVESAEQYSLDAVGVSVGGSLEIRSSTLRSGLAVANGEVRGQLLVRSSELGRPQKRNSLDARGVRVGAEFRVEGPDTVLAGSIVATEARIGRGFGVAAGARIGASYRGRSLSANGCSVGGTLWVEGVGTVLEGALHLRAAELLGRLNLADFARIGVDEYGNSVRAHRMRVTNEIWVRQHCVLDGGFELLDAHIGGPVMIDGGSRVGRNVNGNSVYGPGLRANELYVVNARLVGGLRLTGGRFDGQVLISASTIGAGFDDEAVVLLEASADVFRLDGMSATGSVDLRGAKFGLLDDRPAAWGDVGAVTVRTSGLVIQRLPRDEDFPLESRLTWLSTAEGGGPAEPGVYRAFASAYSGRGDDRAATEVLVEMRRRHSNRWTRVLLAPISQGFRPQRALFWLIGVFLATWALTAVGTEAGWFVSPVASGGGASGAAALAHSNECSSTSETCLRPGLYALDVVLPIIDINATSAWQPESAGWFSGPTLLAWGLAGAALLGWAFGGLFLFGVLNRVLEDSR